MNQKNSQQQKQIRNFTTILTSGIFLIFVFYFVTNKTPSKVKTYEDGVELIDDKFDDLTDKYNELCEKPHNDQLKKKFNDLSYEILKFEGLGEECPGLSYDEQSRLVNYAKQKIKSNTSLYNLYTNGNIDCW